MYKNIQSFVLGMCLVWVPVSMYKIYSITIEIKQIKQEKISGWGND